MRIIAFLSLLLPFFLRAQPCMLTVQAPEYTGQRIILYRYMDLFTLRTEMVASDVVGSSGEHQFSVKVQGTTKALLRVGRITCDLFLRPGQRITVHVPYLEAAPNASIGGTMKFDAEFRDIDTLDPNALISDLYMRLDDLLAADLATDEDAGMQAATQARSAHAKDSTGKAAPTVFAMPTPSKARIDSFEVQLRAHYAAVKDPWFWNELEYGVAGLHIGPGVSPKWLFERYIKDKPIRYDSPEQVRFVRSFYADQVMARIFTTYDNNLLDRVRNAEVDSVKAILARNNYLKTDDRIRELVMMLGLYEQYHGRAFDRKGILGILEQVSSSSAYPEHRVIATNMRWDLTAMGAGSTFPSLQLREPDGDPVQLDDLLEGNTCIAIVLGSSTYSGSELDAMAGLQKEYGSIMKYIVISLDPDLEKMNAHRERRDTGGQRWLWAGEDPLLMDQLRMRSVPVFYLLKDRTLRYSPSPAPSMGMAAILFRMKAEEAEKNHQPFNQPPPPRR